MMVSLAEMTASFFLCVLFLLAGLVFFCVFFVWLCWSRLPKKCAFSDWRCVGQDGRVQRLAVLAGGGWAQEEVEQSLGCVVLSVFAQRNPTPQTESLPEESVPPWAAWCLPPQHASQIMMLEEKSALGPRSG